MNALETLQAIHADIQRTGHWLQADRANPRTLTQMSSRFLDYAQELHQLEQVRIRDLTENGPKLYYDAGGEVTIALLRDGKEELSSFGEWYVTFGRCQGEQERAKWQLTGPPDENGFTYFLRADPVGWTEVAYAKWLTKHEANSLKKQHRQQMDSY